MFRKISFGKIKILLSISFIFFIFSIILSLSLSTFPASAVQLPRKMSPEKNKGDVLYATSSGIDRTGKTFIVLYWNPVEGVKGYNLYRMKKGERKFPKKPINGKKLISSVKTCDELKAIIGEGTREWEMLGNAFSAIAQEKKSLSETGKTVNKKYYGGRPLKESEPGKEQIYDKEKLKKIKTQTIDMESKTLTQLSRIGKMRPDLYLTSVNPCKALERGLTAEEEMAFNMMASVNLKIRLARGLGFIDYDVKADEKYIYELRAVKTKDEEILIATSVEVWAGHFVLPSPPMGFTLEAGDNKVLATWERNPSAFSYRVRRSTSPYGPYQLIHEEPILYDISTDLDGNPIDPPKPGFVDFQRWTEDGYPDTHQVDGVDVSGPENYVTYYYQVASCDILDRTGSWSSYQSATPTDQTPPKTPGDFKIESSSTGLTLSWQKVTRDINSHVELDTSHTYKIYRSDDINKIEDIGSLASYLAHTLTANPTDTTTMTITWKDTHPDLFPPYGEKDFWYRIQVEDAHGNISSPSAVISGRVPDTTPPGSTHVTGADGFADHITVMWDPNPEPDLAGYQIYRSTCDMGVFYQPRSQKPEQELCNFVLLGEILLKEADKRLGETGNIYFEDSSLPEGSPICYSYWVRAFDMARNVYDGNIGCPASPSEYTCQRLYEETPPPAPIISALKAKNNSVLIEWISSPVQDLRAFHVYRSKKETDVPTFVACVFTDGSVSSSKWTGIKPDCADIPGVPDPTTIRISFTDSGLKPNEVYWYRVSALDWLGNESEKEDISHIPAISTFTYSKDLPETPIVLPPSGPPPEGCGLVVKWQPIFNPTALEGFVVFRSSSETGPFRQVSGVVKGNEFIDSSAIKGRNYWYCVQSIDKQGKHSKPSAPVLYTY